MSPTKFIINGRELELDVDPGVTLLSLIRDHAGLTGTKYGCGEGACGSCTVLVDGAPTRSCVTEASKAAGKQITTIEGLGTPDKLHPIQQAFLEHSAFQCGYCTPGMIMSVAAFLKTNPKPSEEDIVSGLEGNICRCGTYPRIVAAVKQAAEKTQEGNR
jgi:aerobic-type carbon monoxide dehydrogenase small subunit (CoxS/CutS family)